MSAINIQTTPTYAASLIQQVASGYSFSTLNVLKNISKVATSIFFLYGLTNLVTTSAEITTSTELSNEHCKKLCMLFLKGQGTNVMDHCFLFCDKTYLS